ncbi:MAG TPA: acyl carrier protein [Opitutaceae bacterium]|nr:acyl carrier protein [Opitutaceae bacterium]
MDEARLKKCFAEAFGLAPEQVKDDLAYQGIKAWDSVGHMALVAALEAEFGVMFDTDEIIALGSVAVARDLLRKRGVYPA